MLEPHKDQGQQRADPDIGSLCVGNQYAAITPELARSCNPVGCDSAHVHIDKNINRITAIAHLLGHCFDDTHRTFSYGRQ